ncbi:hypothetical protein B0T20DRAFT_470426 [Sordaria brevicollis]|uniref:Uncharacterized protein n=1 Tax=Sordaria brevicollis TaxID=83679 RepID=A0AAE0UAA4_SORBR|nr:hypothetical protein B0T20DRAFT_470426 [Sordaria brevicollis]
MDNNQNGTNNRAAAHPQPQQSGQTAFYGTPRQEVPRRANEPVIDLFNYSEAEYIAFLQQNPWLSPFPQQAGQVQPWYPPPSAAVSQPDPQQHPSGQTEASDAARAEFQPRATIPDLDLSIYPQDLLIAALQQNPSGQIELSDAEIQELERWANEPALDLSNYPQPLWNPYQQQSSWSGTSAQQSGQVQQWYPPPSSAPVPQPNPQQHQSEEQVGTSGISQGMGWRTNQAANEPPSVPISSYNPMAQVPLNGPLAQQQGQAGYLYGTLAEQAGQFDHSYGTFAQQAGHVDLSYGTFTQQAGQVDLPYGTFAQQAGQVQHSYLPGSSGTTSQIIPQKRQFEEQEPSKPSAKQLGKAPEKKIRLDPTAPEFFPTSATRFPSNSTRSGNQNSSHPQANQPILGDSLPGSATSRDHIQDGQSSEASTSQRSGGGLYKCGQCGQIANTRKAHWNHVKRTMACQAEIAANQCGRCGRRTQELASHQVHLQASSRYCTALAEPVKYECVFDGETFFDKEKHVEHLDKCSKRREEYQGREALTSAVKDGKSTRGEKEEVSACKSRDPNM